AKNDEFDVQGAREAGYDDAEIVSHLTRGKGFSRSGGPAHAALRGVYVGLADMAGTVLGAPGDAANWAMRKMGVNVEPSDYMGAPRRALSKLPTPSGGTQWTYEGLEDLPPGERPFAVGGEVVGASVPIAGAPLAAVRAGAKGPKLLKPIMDAARTKPGQFAAVEAGSVAGSAQLGGAAEAIRPGDPVARFVGEAAGAFVNPIGQAARVVGGSVRKAKQVAQGYTQAGRENAAADTLQGALREAGEDPEALARTLAEPDVTPGIEGLTAGQKTGSPTLLAVEANLAKRSPHFAGEARKAADEGLASLRTAIDELVRSGDPESLKRAAQLRETYFSQLLDRRVTTALRKAEEASTRVPPRGRSQAHDPSIEAEQALQEALSDARAVESQLWSAIDRRVPIRPEGLKAAHAEVRQQLLKEETLDGVTEKFLSRTAPLKEGAKAPGRPTSAEMLRFRKHLLAQARQQEARQNPDFARL
ncbi:MAG TPA: hypothetical protein VMN43_00300, partial [Aestuariivirgaceae bacterium]|nr:hypothetical protein [Aestuariivirgaceae bacterium]